MSELVPRLQVAGPLLLTLNINPFPCLALSVWHFILIISVNVRAPDTIENHAFAV